MDDYPGQPPTPNPPPPAAPPTYQAPPPAPPQPPAPGPQYAAPAAAPKKRKTWLWVLLGVVLLSLLACGAGVYFFVDLLAGPAKSITALNEAAADGDQDEVERYFDVESVAQNAYASFLDVILESEDGQALIDEFGSEEDARAFIEEQLPEDDFVQSMVEEFSVDGEEPFPNPEITNTEIENNEAVVTMEADLENEDGDTDRVEWVLRMEKNDGVWQIVEIVNLADLLVEQGFI